MGGMLSSNNVSNPYFAGWSKVRTDVIFSDPEFLERLALLHTLTLERPF
jgi:hypothetical protein